MFRHWSVCSGVLGDDLFQSTWFWFNNGLLGFGLVDYSLLGFGLVDNGLLGNCLVGIGQVANRLVVACLAMVWQPLGADLFPMALQLLF